MRSLPATTAHFNAEPGFWAATTGFVDEVYGTISRLCAYLVALALLAIGGIALWQHLPDVVMMETSQGSWSQAGRATPAFAVSQFVFPGKAETYEIHRHPGGGRKGIFRWSGIGHAPVAELEIYRPGGEADEVGSVAGHLATRWDPAGPRETDAAGIADSKFGPATLFRSAGGTEQSQACLQFYRNLGSTKIRLSGWSCLGDDLPARRAAIGCMLNRLVLLTAGNDAELAELFARAEIKRSDCPGVAGPAAPADWVMGAGNPPLRGTL